MRQIKIVSMATPLGGEKGLLKFLFVLESVIHLRDSFKNADSTSNERSEIFMCH